MAVKERQNETLFDEIEWNVENEIQLFFAMNGHKPVGINKYFHMVCIWEKFRAAIHKDIPLKIIWDHLESMYDLMALDDMEDLPFPSHEIDFSLPETEFVGRPRKREELEIKLKDQRDKYKEIKKEKDIKESSKKDSMLRDFKGTKDVEKKKEETKKCMKETDIKKDKFKDVKETKKEHKSSKGRSKGKEDLEESASNGKKERKESESSRELAKRISKRPTRQSVDSSSKASSSPCDTPPPKRRRM
ncbi:PREDICTED: MRG/MORF4L-binding protein [Cyphomyrmex costatus]|uniref:MRG-binding protein n=1 Tax=Cyphomyrmex costatus TaxID=456900 RepID=A0A151IDS7_9HYME|nr:PREDICTED: MRG/MORF4L-binding protein [Cyphomyrmex costatus]XP_018399998.1 PREDICTED: MRG/MORF4L-binding protein [Cyphomyrmex costatus]KYM98409.1 MRG-binding protein [Cyphomyrmex costatus]